MNNIQQHDDYPCPYGDGDKTCEENGDDCDCNDHE